MLLVALFLLILRANDLSIRVPVSYSKKDIDDLSSIRDCGINSCLLQRTGD